MKIFNVFYNIVSIVIIAVFVFTIGIKTTNTSVFAVATPSMEDELYEGDMVFVRQAGEYVEGDIITARLSSGGTFTHRISYVDKENGMVYTQGDNNPQPDPMPTPIEDIVGKVIFSVPLLGNLALEFNSVNVILVLAGLLLALMLARFVVFKIKKPKENKAV